MDPEDRYIWIVAGLGVLILVANWLLGGYEWYQEKFAGLLKVETHKSGTAAAMMLIGAAVLGSSLLANARNESPKLIAHNDITTWNPIDDAPDPAGEWYVIRRGGKVAMGFYVKGRQGANIIHRDAWHSYAKFGLQSVNLLRTPRRKLPIEVRNLIAAKRLKGPFYFGQGSEFIEARVKDFSKEARIASARNAEQDVHSLAQMEALDTMAKRVQMLETIATTQNTPTLVSWWERRKAERALRERERDEEG